MRHNKDKGFTPLDELLEPFFPDEHAETGTAVAVEFRNRLVKLEQQVMAQYTSMAAYATIGQTEVHTARAENRSDLDRSQGTLIGLMEKLRNEFNVRLDGMERGSPAGDLPLDAESRFNAVERDLAEATSSLQQCIRENEHLRSQVADLVEHRMQAEGWLVSSGASVGLSLR